MTAAAPSKTLYVRNLNESVKLPVLKQDLQTTFSQFGNVINVVAHKNLKMRGQAFVVFEDLAAAEAALKQVRGFEYHGKKMDVQFAKTASDATVLREEGDELFEQHKKRRLEIKEQKKAAEATNKAKRLQQAAAAQQPVRKPRPASQPAVAQQHNPPNKILFISNLPDSMTKEELIQIYSKFDGFREVRTVPGRKGIAFVEYDTEGQAGLARVNTSKLILDGNAVQVVFQRKIN